MNERRFHNDGSFCMHPDCSKQHEWDRMCMCGHPAFIHHRSWWGGRAEPVIEECEYYGFNESGGMMPHPTERNQAGHPVWVQHCDRFEPADPL